MKFLTRLLLLCIFWCGTAFAQTTPPVIDSSNCEKPSYPSASSRLSEEGTVQLRFLVGKDGKVIESAVEKSTGFRRLDEAARQGLSKCTFKPGFKDGFAVESWASMKFTWRQELPPPCLGSDVSKWRSCLGTLTTQMGGLSVVEYKAGKKSGRGVEYDGSGKVIRAGIFEGENLVSERSLDTKLYPFNAQLTGNAANQSVNAASVPANISSSNLPTCNVSDTGSCYGILNFPNGARYEGEFREGIRFGRGIEFDHRGNYSRNGYWNDWQFSTTPFSSLAPTVSNIPDPSKAERDRLAADLEASRKKQQELEEQLRASQVAATQSSRPAQNISTERRVALVIGNAAYKVNPLKNPVNDSTDMARSLRSVGFDVIEANNTTLAQMREVTRRFADKLGTSDVGLVYYSGHGVEVKGKNYLIPVNADIKREYEVVDQAFDAGQFLEMMDNIRGPNNKRVNILIVDACRNNELQKSWRSTNNGLARMDAPGGTFISFATAPGRVAADGVGRNSPYTKHLLQALKQPNVPIEQVFKVVRRNVMEETKGEQIPWENSSLVGDFYFTVQR